MVDEYARILAMAALNSGGGGGTTAGVTTFNGRQGNVVPQAGDYTPEQVGSFPNVGGTMGGNIDMNNHSISNIDTMTSNSIAAPTDGNPLAVESNVDMNNHKITQVAEPTNTNDVATKNYVDSNKYTLPIAETDTLGGIKIGSGLTIDDQGSVSVEALTQETADARYLQLSGGTLSGNLNMGNHTITYTGTPTQTTDLASKGYVDGVVGVVSQEVDDIITGKSTISIPIATDTKVGGIKNGGNVVVDSEGNANAPTYTLPIASASTLGGVKIGTGIDISEDGTISATSSPAVTNIATEIEPGIVKPGEGLSIHDDGTLDATIQQYGDLDSGVVFLNPNQTKIIKLYHTCTGVYLDFHLVDTTNVAESYIMYLQTNETDTSADTYLTATLSQSGTDFTVTNNHTSNCMFILYGTNYVVN